MPRRKQAQEIVHLPPDHPNQDLTRTDLETQPPYSPEHRDTLAAWAQYAQETAMDRASYDNAVDAARYARERAYEAARENHSKAVAEADKAFDEASTAAWKTFYANSDSARHDRDLRLDEIRKDLVSIELQHAMVRGQEAVRRIAGDDGGYEVFGDMLHYNDEGMHTHPGTEQTIQVNPGERLCPRCMTVNHVVNWQDDVCPNCGQYVAPLEVLHPPIREEHTDPETPAAPDAPAGIVGQQERATSESAAE